jgi:hypothetical protein
MTRSLDIEDISARVAGRDLSLARNRHALKVLDLPVQGEDTVTPSPRQATAPASRRPATTYRSRDGRIRVIQAALVGAPQLVICISVIARRKAAGLTGICSQPGDYDYMTPAGVLWLTKCEAKLAAGKKL